MIPPQVMIFYWISYQEIVKVLFAFLQLRKKVQLFRLHFDLEVIGFLVILLRSDIEPDGSVIFLLMQK